MSSSCWGRGWRRRARRRARGGGCRVQSFYSTQQQLGGLPKAPGNGRLLRVIPLHPVSPQPHRPTKFHSALSHLNRVLPARRTGEDLSHLNRVLPARRTGEDLSHLNRVLPARRTREDLLGMRIKVIIFTTVKYAHFMIIILKLCIVMTQNIRWHCTVMTLKIRWQFRKVIQ